MRKLSNEQIESLIIRATHDIEQLLLSKEDFENHCELAELHFERAEMYLAAKKFKWAIEDYNTCLDYDPYFYQADMGREMVYLTMEEGKIAAN